MGCSKMWMAFGFLRAAVSAADCSTGRCATAQDETSLIQVMQNVGLASERFNPAGDFPTDNLPNRLADLNAIALAEPVGIETGDFPAVMESFAHGVAKVRDEVQDKAEDRILFASNQRLQRNLEKKAFQANMKAVQQTVKDEQAADAAAIAETQRIRKERLAHAKELVDNAKANAAVLKIKAAQAEAAAVMGRQIGAVQGADASNLAWSGYKKAIASEKKQSAIEAAQAKVAAHEASVRAAVEKKTAAMASAEHAKVAAADKAVKKTMAEGAAKAAVKMEDVGGPEGIKNRLVEEKADWAVHQYKLQETAAQERIDLAAAGIYPEVVPGISPEQAAADAQAEAEAISAASWGQSPELSLQ